MVTTDLLSPRSMFSCDIIDEKLLTSVKSLKFCTKEVDKYRKTLTDDDKKTHRFCGHWIKGQGYLVQ
jgi:hypothetical protein